MSKPAEPDLSFEAFQWADAFSTHLRGLGAPNASGQLFDLGRQLYLEYSELDAIEIAETVWSKWPSQVEPFQ
jgi:hypothetical protein